jgi:hypothetical protein
MLSEVTKQQWAKENHYSFEQKRKFQQFEARNAKI